jgi:hypothetical protein
VQPDRRLVQHVQHARQARPDLRRQADALALAARQRAAGPVEIQVIEPDIVEEAQPLDDLLQDRLRDGALLVGQMFGRPVKKASASTTDRRVA